MDGIEAVVRRIVREEVRAALSEWEPRVLQQGESVSEGLLTSREAAELLGVAEAAMRDWRTDRKGPMAVKGRASRPVPAGDVEAWAVQER